MKHFSGTVKKVNNTKTAHVEIVTEWMHPKYLKKRRFSKIFACHSEEVLSIGDEVMIVECKPLSATKFFELITRKESTSVLRCQTEPKKSTTGSCYKRKETKAVEKKQPRKQEGKSKKNSIKRKSGNMVQLISTYGADNVSERLRLLSMEDRRQKNDRRYYHRFSC
jgi:small subunit ribosomal protein S17